MCPDLTPADHVDQTPALRSEASVWGWHQQVPGPEMDLRRVTRSPTQLLGPMPKRHLLLLMMMMIMIWHRQLSKRAGVKCSDLRRTFRDMQAIQMITYKLDLQTSHDFKERKHDRKRKASFCCFLPRWSVKKVGWDTWRHFSSTSRVCSPAWAMKCKCVHLVANSENRQCVFFLCKCERWSPWSPGTSTFIHVSVVIPGLSTGGVLRGQPQSYSHDQAIFFLTIFWVLINVLINVLVPCHPHHRIQPLITWTNC